MSFNDVSGTRRCNNNSSKFKSASSTLITLMILVITCFVVISVKEKTRQLSFSSMT